MNLQTIINIVKIKYVFSLYLYIMRNVLFLIVLWLSSFIIAWCSNNSEITSINNTIDWRTYTAQGTWVEYKILTTTNMDRSNFERDRHRVWLWTGLSNQNIDETAYYIIKSLIKSDPTLDEIILWFHSEEGWIDGAYDLWSAIWAYWGELWSVLDSNVNTDSRRWYKIKFVVKDNISEYMSTKFNSEDVWWLWTEDRRQIFIELVAIEDKAILDADKKYDFYNISNESEFKRISKMNWEYYDKQVSDNKVILCKSWDITQEQLNDISREWVKKARPFE